VAVKSTAGRIGRSRDGARRTDGAGRTAWNEAATRATRLNIARLGRGVRRIATVNAGAAGTVVAMIDSIVHRARTATASGTGGQGTDANRTSATTVSLTCQSGTVGRMHRATATTSTASITGVAMSMSALSTGEWTMTIAVPGARVKVCATVLLVATARATLAISGAGTSASEMSAPAPKKDITCGQGYRRHGQHPWRQILPVTGQHRVSAPDLSGESPVVWTALFRRLMANGSIAGGRSVSLPQFQRQRMERQSPHANMSSSLLPSLSLRARHRAGMQPAHKRRQSFRRSPCRRAAAREVTTMMIVTATTATAAASAQRTATYRRTSMGAESLAQRH
jgi:hypothetical protein